MSARPRLVHVTTTDISLALLLGPQLRAFAQAGYEVIGVSAPGPFVAELEAAGIEHVALSHATRAVSPRDDARAPFELRRVFRSLAPDIVHTHNPKPGVYGRIAARLAGVPVIVNTVHGLYALPSDRLRKRAVVYGLERVAAACSHAELVQNVEDLAVLHRIGVPDRRVHLLGNGIDLTRFDPERPEVARRAAELRARWGCEPGDVVCGVVGRLVWEKGYREVFAAARALAGSEPRVRVVVIGPRDDAKGDAVDASSIERAERDGLLFLGMRTDMEDLYAAMDLYVLASYREGFPRSAMEAAAMGLPVVATDIRGCRQVVDDGVTGRLVAPRDTAALARAMASLVGDRGARSAMAHAARVKARRDFDQERVIATTLGVYARELTRAGRPVPEHVTPPAATPADVEAPPAAGGSA